MVTKESIEDKESKVFNTIILHDSIEAAKSKLKNIKLKGIVTHGVFNSFFFYFLVEQSPSFLEFINWCIDNYSLSEGVIMDMSRSRMPCPINSLTIRNTPIIPPKFT